jgi:hypothetical protein
VNFGGRRTENVFCLLPATDESIALVEKVLRLGGDIDDPWSDFSDPSGCWQLIGIVHETKEPLSTPPTTVRHGKSITVNYIVTTFFCKHTQPNLSVRKNKAAHALTTHIEICL